MFIITVLFWRNNVGQVSYEKYSRMLSDLILML